MKIVKALIIVTGFLLGATAIAVGCFLYYLATTAPTTLLIIMLILCGIVSQFMGILVFVHFRGFNQ